MQSGTQQDISMKIFDMTGREAHSSTQRTNNMIEVGQELQTGVYMLMVRTPTKMKTVKVMKIE